MFYGWWIVGAAFLMAFYVGGVIFYGFTAIFEPIAREFGWSYAQISLAASLRGLEMGILAPLTGIMADRWGPRRLIFSGVIITSFGLILLSMVDSLLMFYVSFAVIACGTSAFSITILVTAVAHWFRQKVSLAIGITSAGYGFSGLLIPLVVKLIDMYQWRMAMVIFGLGLCLIGIPISRVFRHRPEQYGYLPDGKTAAPGIPEEDVALIKSDSYEYKLKQAIRNRAFWHIALASTIHSAILHAVVIHVMPYLSTISIARFISGWVASGIPLMSIIGRLGFGWLGDIFNKKRLATISFAFVNLGLFFFVLVSNGGIWLLLPFLFFFGIGYGGNNINRVALVREYFGRNRFGSIHGFVMGIMTLGHISGPFITGWVFDTTGTYRGIWFALVGLALTALIIMATLPPAEATTRPADRTDS